MSFQGRKDLVSVIAYCELNNGEDQLLEKNKHILSMFLFDFPFS
jgi:hypothetical protein